MGLLDDIQQEQSVSHIGPKCIICKLLASMSAADRSDFETALDDVSIYGTVIARVFQKRGHSISNYQVQRHRRKECVKQ